jgi:transposase InsO family protein
MRRYLLTFIDPASRFALAVALPSKASRHTQSALSAALSLLPTKPQVVLSDNGSEFEADFAKALETHGMKRWYTYPKSPRMNAHVERFNRTVQDAFVDYHEELLFTDLALFNQKLADWLLFYNAQRPHQSLGQQPPLHFLLQHQPECQRWWTHTRARSRGRAAL